MNELVLATHNAGKVREISEMLAPYVDTFYSAGELDLPEPEDPIMDTKSPFSICKSMPLRTSKLVNSVL